MPQPSSPALTVKLVAHTIRIRRLLLAHAACLALSCRHAPTQQPTQGKSVPTNRCLINKSLALGLSLALGALPLKNVYALPQNGQVVSGDAQIQQTTPEKLTIQQNSQKTIIDWDNFDIQQNETTEFMQPNQQSLALNRVNSGNLSEIYGQLKANGRILLINPNGIIFGGSAQVDVGGLVAATSHISQQNFHDNNFSFDQVGLSNATIENHGHITAADEGLIALVAPRVTNNGTITARLGRIQLAGGDKFTLDLFGDQLVNLQVDTNHLPASVVENNGLLASAGGVIALTAGQAETAVDAVINMHGIAQANTVEQQDGRIILGQKTDRTNIHGTLTAAQIDVLGDKVALYEQARLNANTPDGRGQIRVGGGVRGEQINGENSRRIYVAAGAELTADATAEGDGGVITVWAEELTGFNGHARAQGGSAGGDGGFIEVSGKQNLIFNGTADTTAPQGALGELLLDPINITIVDGAVGADDAEISDNEILQGDSAGSSFIISEETIEAITGATALTLEASNDIVISNLTDDELGFSVSANVTMSADNDLNGTGDFIMNPNDTILTSGGTLTINGANVTLGEIDTTSFPNGNVTVGAANNINLYRNILTDDGNLIMNGDVILQDNVTFSTGTGNGSFIGNGNISGAHTFSFNNGTGNVSLNNVDIATLNLLNTGNLTLDGNITTDTPLNFSNLSNINLLNDTVITAMNGATPQNITFDTNQELNGLFDLTLVGNNMVLPSIGNTSPLTSVDITSDGTATIGGPIITSGSQTYNGNLLFQNSLLQTTDSPIDITGDITLATDVTMDAGIQNISIDGNVNGGFDLTLDSGTLGNVNITGSMGNITPVDTVNLSGAAITLGGGVQSQGAQTYNGTADIAGNFATTNDNILFNNNVVLTGNTSMNTGAGGGNIDFGGTINGPFDLNLDADTGITTLTNPVGNVTPLNNLTLAGTAVALTTITTTGAQNYTGSLSLNGDLTVTTGGIDLAGAITLAGDSTLTSGGGASDNIELTGGITGDNTLGIDAGLGELLIGNIDIDTLDIISAGNLNLLGGTVTTDSAQNYTNADDLILSGNTIFTANDGVNDQDIILDANNTIQGAGNLSMFGATITLFDVANIIDLNLNASTALNLNVDLSINGGIDLSGNALNLAGSLNSNGNPININAPTTLLSDLDIITGNAPLTLNDTVDGAYNLGLDAGTNTLNVNGDVGLITPLVSLNATGNPINVQNVTTTGAQNYTGPVNATGLLSGGSAVNMDTDVTLDGGVTTSFGNISIGGDVLLAADSILQSGGSAADAIDITGNITGPYQLTFDAGLADINLDGNMDINALVFSGGDDLTLGGSTYTTSQNMDFTGIDDIALTNDTTFTASDGVTDANILMDTDNTITGVVNLAFNGNQVTLNQIGIAPGDPNNMLSLTVNANTFNLLGAVYTQNEQVFNSLDGLTNDLFTDNADITLNTDINLLDDVTISTGAGGGNILFSDVVDGPFNIVLDAGTGTVTSNAGFGTNTPLASLSITGSQFSLGSVRTTGAQTYSGIATLNGDYETQGGNISFNNGPVTLAGNIRMDTGSTTGGDITLSNAVNGNSNLTLAAGTGDINFGELAGALNRLGVFTIESAHNINLEQGIFVTDYVQQNTTGSVNFGLNPGLDALSNIIVSQPSSIAGGIEGNNVLLESSGLIDVDVNVANLTIGGPRSSIQGTIGNKRGRVSARSVKFSFLNGGAHFINGYNVPLVGDVTAPQAMGLTRPTTQGSVQPYGTTTVGGAAPFQTAYSTFTQPAPLVTENQLDEPLPLRLSQSLWVTDSEWQNATPPLFYTEQLDEL